MYFDLKHWEENGFLILKNFFGEHEVKKFTDEVKISPEDSSQLIKNATVDILEGESIGQRKKFSSLSSSEKKCSLKINDLYLELDSCRQICLSDKLCRILSVLLGDLPTIINSLTFNKGSQQPSHFDTYYMPPPTQGKMIVSSICLEDQSVESGPLNYFPGSHLIKPYVFSHGGIHEVEEEMSKARHYIEEEIAKRGLKKEVFVGKFGDVFIWHGQLYHGGNEIVDHSLTRKTIVTHYWARSDLDNKEVISFGKDGSYLMRSHQKI